MLSLLEVGALRLGLLMGGVNAGIGVGAGAGGGGGGGGSSSSSRGVIEDGESPLLCFGFLIFQFSKTK